MHEKESCVILITIYCMFTTVNCTMFTFNAALNRPSFQSSVYTDSDGTVYPASLANDGHQDTSSGCSLTRPETSPWWAVDLGGPTTVARVDLTNIAATQCGNRSRNFIVGLTNVHPLVSTPTLWNYTLCGQYPGAVPAAATVSLYCQHNLPPFRYVIVQFPLINDFVSICELEVITHGDVPNPKFHNVARLKPVYQVSTYMDQHGTYPARLANDGSRRTTSDYCAASQPATNPWWAVDLGVPTTVFSVKLTSRGDANGYRSNNFVVGLTNDHPGLHAPVLWNYTLCGQYPGAVPDGVTVTVQCTGVYNRGLRFRYVIVQFPLINDQMNVCEIEVFRVDINKCSLSNSFCSPLVSCHSSISGSFTCTCPPGYTFDAFDCTLSGTGMVQLYDKSGRAVTVSSSDTVTLSANVQGATTFMMVPCRALSTVPDSLRRRCVSLMDANRADWYVRHRGFYLYVDAENQTDNLPLFQVDSSFILHANTFYSGYYAFQSVNGPAFYIKSQVDDRLKITRRSNTTDYYDTASFSIYYSNASKLLEDTTTTFTTESWKEKTTRSSKTSSQALPTLCREVVDNKDKVQSNSLFAAITALSVVAGVAIIAAVILLIVVIKLRAKLR